MAVPFRQEYVKLGSLFLNLSISEYIYPLYQSAVHS